MSVKNSKPNSKIEENSEISSFIALWDEQIGPEIVDFYPQVTIGDLEKLAVQIFTVYQFFWDTPESPYQRTSFVLPIALNKKVKVLFDVIPNAEVRGGLQPFIVVLIAPDYLSDEDLNEFNEIILKITQRFSRKEEITLKTYYPELFNLFKSKKSVLEKEVELSKFYSYTAAMEDFQAGIKLFQTKNLEKAYELLRKVLLKFEQEQHKHLIVEVLYVIASIFTQQKKYKTANEYFKRLQNLAEDINHDKYNEISLFMQGFCEYKNENFISAKNKFEKIDVIKSKFINKLQFHTIYGRVLENLEKFEESAKQYQEALKITEKMGKSELEQKQNAQILYELGINQYRLAVEILKKHGFEKQEKFEVVLREAVDNFTNSIQILKNLNDYDVIAQIYQFIGDIFEFLEKDLEALENYEEAFKYAQTGNKPNKQVVLLKKVVQKLVKSNKYEDAVIKIKDFLSKINNFKFIDLYTVSNLRYLLANSLIALDKKREALNELLNAHQILKSFKFRTQEELNVLNQIVKIYSEMGNGDKVLYYNDEINNVSKVLKEASFLSQPKIFRPMGDLKEIWIFHAVAGVEIFNYALESKIDNDLMGGFLTALRQFSLEISQKQFNDMIIGDDYFIMYQEEGFDFYILGRAPSKVSREVIKKILSTIYRRFWKEYSKYIIDFKGNVKFFQDFRNVIESLDLTLTV